MGSCGSGGRVRLAPLRVLPDVTGTVAIAKRTAPGDAPDGVANRPLARTGTRAGGGQPADREPRRPGPGPRFRGDRRVPDPRTARQGRGGRLPAGRATQLRRGGRRATLSAGGPGVLSPG